MKGKALKWFEIGIESICYLVIQYALSSMAIFCRRSPVWILFFASEMWVMERYGKRIYDLTHSKVASGVLWIVCFIVHVGIVYVTGYIAGDFVPWQR